MAAAQFVDYADYSALLLRRTFPDLNQPGAIMDRAKSWWGKSAARWNEDQKSWRFPSGAIVKFGHLEHDKDINNYYGSEYQFIGFDEATQFSERMYTQLFARNRRKKGSPIPLRVRAASNPGGVGHEWVKQRFLVEGEANRRAFVPARLDDNPSIDQEEYRIALYNLDPITRAQLLDGDWSVRGTGATFRREWFKVIETPNTEYERIVRAWDKAATAPLPGYEDQADWTVGTLMGRSPAGTLDVLDVARMQGSPGEVEVFVRNTAMADAGRWGGGVEVWLEQEPGAAGKYEADRYVLRVLPDFYVTPVRSTGAKPVRASPFASHAHAGNVRILRGIWNTTWYEELEAFPNAGHDDQVDSAALAANALLSGGELRPASEEVEALFHYRS